MVDERPSFEGWCTKANLRCSDGRTIMKDAFKDNDGTRVPLVWNHQHDDVSNVLGHADLENRDEGVWARCYFNNTQRAQDAMEDVRHGDICSLSIYANRLKQEGSNVVHGVIREVSLVLSGANPGASIISSIQHGDDADESAVIYSGEEGIYDVTDDVDDTLEHSDDEPEEETEVKKEDVIEHADDDETLEDIWNSMNEKQQKLVQYLVSKAKGGSKSEEEPKEVEHSDSEGETLDDIWNSMNEKQQTLAKYLVGKAVGGSEEVEHSDSDDEDEQYSDEDNEEEDSMKHNVFDEDVRNEGLVLTHSDQANIIKGMKKYGSFNESLRAYAEAAGVDDAELMHADSDYGIERSVTAKTYGVDHTTLQDQNYFVNDPSFLFPDARELNNVPKFIQRKMDWVAGVISGTKHSPFSRVKTRFADITADEARAKGYIKGKLKKEEVFTLLKRTTTPTTIYKKQKMDRDDLVDITDFDVVSWIRNEMRMMLNEELARAILFGDGRLSSSDDKINEQNIRPIWIDHELFTINKKVEFAANATEDDQAKAIIKAAVKSRKDYRGAGNPTCYMTEDMLTNMLLLEDGIGHRLYKTEAEVASAMRVSRIVTVPLMDNLTRTVAVEGGGSETRTLQAIIVNLSDYQVGTDRGGEIKSYEQFDIDYNQEKYLLETRCSGALITPYSAIVIESVTAAGGNGGNGGE